MCVCPFRLRPCLCLTGESHCSQLSMLPSPYGDCRDAENYTLVRCLGQCMGEFVVSRCGCRSLELYGKICLKEYNSFISCIIFLYAIVICLTLLHLRLATTSLIAFINRCPSWIVHVFHWVYAYELNVHCMMRYFISWFKLLHIHHSCWLTDRLLHRFDR